MSTFSGHGTVENSAEQSELHVARDERCENRAGCCRKAAHRAKDCYAE